MRPPKSVAGFATTLTVLFTTAIVVMTMSMAAFGWRYKVVGDIKAGSGSVTDAVASDNFVRVTSILTLVLLIGLAIVYLCWLFRARTNTEAWGGVDHKYGRGWAIGGWVTPIGNFWIPFRVVADVHRNSVPASMSRGDVPPEFRIWWGLVLAAAVMGRINPGTDTLDGLRNDTLVNMAYVAALIAAAVFALLVVRRISKAQGERTAEWHVVVAGGESPLGLLLPAQAPDVASWSAFGPR
jgi:hypothetical protein